MNDPQTRLWKRRPLLRSPRAFAGVSIAAALATITLKMAAYRVTGSVGLLSDATEGVVNLFAAIIAFWMLTLAALPPDEEHDYGHTKAEYFSSGVEGALILVAALSIGYTALDRLQHPQPLDNVWLGLGISTIASCINGAVARLLLSGSRSLHSITLKADALHLLTDVWTSIGVIVALVLIKITGWLILDPLIALVVAANIVWTGARLISESVHGLLDTALPIGELQAIEGILEPYRRDGIAFHAMRSRQSGQRSFLSIHVLMPGDWSIQKGHDICEEIECKIIGALPRITVITHLEPVEDPLAFSDQNLDRDAPALS